MGRKKEALKDLVEIREWLYKLGPTWNYFGDLERAKKRIDRAIGNLKKNA